MYEYDEWIEKSQQDEIIQEATFKLINVVKDEVKAYYQGIAMQNESLVKEIERLMEIERDLSLKQRELEQKEKTLEREFYKKKWSEILKDFSYTYYQVCNKWKKQEQCGLCDDDRKITFTSPQGETLRQNCKCSHANQFYMAKEVKFANINVYKSNEYSRDDQMGYSIKFESRNDNDECWVELNSKKIRNNFEVEKGRDTYDVVYMNLEECQKHCDYLNAIQTEVSK